jgi:hypothetical protein
LSLLRDLVPPLAVRSARTVRDRLRKPGLFEGDDRMFKAYAAKARAYGEYGMGASTNWMLANTDIPVHAVDTARPWVDSVIAANPDQPRLTAIWIDVGPIQEWGYPVGYSHRHNFEAYRTAIWRQATKPDLVLVDGRFRVACFLHSLRVADPGTIIIIDDYALRPDFHVVEELIPVSERCGRQVLFVRPSSIDEAAVAELEQAFAFVMA